MSDLRMAMDGLAALAAIIERSPVDDVHLTKNLALAVAGEIRTVLAALARPRAAKVERDDIAAAIEEMTRADWDAWVAEASGSRMHSASVAATYRKADAILELQSPPAKVAA